MTNKDVRSEIIRRAAEIRNRMDNSDIFCSSQFASHMQGLADNMIGFSGERVTVKQQYEAKGNLTAQTNKATIIMNCGNELVSDYEAAESQYRASVGMLSHECSHVLFWDCDETHRVETLVKSGTIPCDDPVFDDPQLTQDYGELKAAIESKKYGNLFFSLFDALENNVIDQHDENRMIERYPGLISNSIFLLRESLRAHLPSFESLRKGVNNRECDINTLMSLVLQWCRFGDVIAEDADAFRSSREYEILKRSVQAIDAASNTDDSTHRTQEIFRIMTALWPSIRDILDAAQTQSNKNASGGNNTNSDPGSAQGQNPAQGSGSALEHAVSSMIQAIQQAAANSGQSAVPQGRRSSENAKQQSSAGTGAQASAPAPQSAAAKADAEKSAQNSVEVMIQQIATEQAERDVTAMIESSVNAKIKTVDMNSTHKGVPLAIIPMTDITAEDRAAYDQMMRDLAPYSKRLQRQMLEALRDLRAGSTAYHKVTGQHFEARDAYRPDQRYFSRKTLPQDLPDMAVSMLVDHSGSMHGQRIHESMRAAMLLYDFAAALNIPVSVSGHSTTGTQVRYYTYTSFERVTASEKYRLAKMTASGCNRDGMAIQIAGDLLAKRPEDIKLLIIISDGQPNASNYGGSGAAEDIRSIVRSLKKKGVEVIAAAIGEDKENIKEIYGSGAFLDVSNLDAFPKDIVRLVKRRVI